MSTKEKSESIKFMEKATGGPLTVGRLLKAYRLNEDLSQADLAKKLGISRVHLTQIENGHKTVSPERAKVFAKKMGRLEILFIELSLQEMLAKAGLKYKIKLEAA